jgi:hypothetical protein
MNACDEHIRPTLPAGNPFKERHCNDLGCASYSPPSRNRLGSCRPNPLEASSARDCCRSRRHRRSHCIHRHTLRMIKPEIWPGPAMKLVDLLAARSPGLRLALALALEIEIERHCSADEILQGRLIDLVAFMDVDGTPDIPVEAGVEQT